MLCTVEQNEPSQVDLLRNESKKAVTGTEDVCNVEGVDATCIGSADISARYMHLGDMSRPNMWKAIDGVYEATNA
jgi:2-keto-3-deoxy-L-rhamnonate aldolase RhmA